MKINICNVPLRGDKEKTIYPPLGALAIVTSLSSAGYDASFYDINFFRPSEAEIRNYFIENHPDIVGISATVATSYKFVKKMVPLIRSILPDSVIVVGGALTASSEVVLKFNDVDFCVIGEGEKVIVNLADYIKSHPRQWSHEELKKIKGLCFLDDKRNVIFTGYERQLSQDAIPDTDYGIIERDSNIDQYIIDPFIYEQFKYDNRSFEEWRKNKRLATVVSSRGCINRCTFCYRWQKGIRVFSIDKVIGEIKDLMKKYNVGFISFGDENFGVSKKWIEEFIEKVKPLDILYRISGICCENVNPTMLKKLKESGCVAIQYGFESGSNKMLKVIEKRSNVELNKKAAIWTHEAGIQTVPTLLVGMPGESYVTIKETTNFVKSITGFWSIDPVININTLVVLPGTPAYEYARHNRLLGKTLKDEERYLLKISDQGGSKFLKHINLTDYPHFILSGWIRCIYWAARYHYYKVHNFPRKSTVMLFYEMFGILLGRKKNGSEFHKNLYANPLFYHLRYVIAPTTFMCGNFIDNKRLFAERLIELLLWPLKTVLKRNKFSNYVSLRTLLNERSNISKEMSPYSPLILRVGR